MEFLKPILPVFRMWQYCGLAPLSLEIGFPSTKFYKYYSYSIIFIQVITYVIGIAYNDFYVDWTDLSIMSYMDLITLNAVHFISILIHIETIIKRNKQIQFYKKIRQIDRIFSENLGFHQNFYLLRNQTALDCGFCILELSLMYVTNVIYSIQNNKPKFLNYWFIYSVPLAISNIRYIQFVAFIRLIKLRLEVIHCCFKRIILFENIELNKVIVGLGPNNQIRVEFDPFGLDTESSLVYEEIIFLRQCYYFLWEASVLVNKSFHWTMPFAIGNDFCTLVTNFYWIFLWMVQPSMSDLSVLFVSIVWGLANVRHFVTITNVCQRTIDEVCYYDVYWDGTRTKFSLFSFRSMKFQRLFINSI